MKEETKTQQIQSETKDVTFDNDADFLCFDEIKKAPKGKIDKFDRERLYPWLSDKTLECKDMHSLLHNEILDFVNWIQPSKSKKE